MIATLSINSGDKMYPLKKTQIAHLKADKAPTKLFNKYIDFIDFFLSKLAAKLFECTEINNYALKWVDYQQSPYSSIYNLS